MPQRTIHLGDWEFQLDERPWGWFISVPDVGGMADSIPRVPEQLAWAEQAFATLPTLRQVWATTWEVPPESLPELEALFRQHGGVW